MQNLSVKREEAVIPAGTSESQAIDIEALCATSGYRLFGLDLPTLTNAAITFLVSNDGGANFKPMRDATQTEFTITASTGGSYIYLDPAVFSAITHFKLQSGTTAAPVNQAAARTIICVMRPV